MFDTNNVSDLIKNPEGRAARQITKVGTGAVAVAIRAAGAGIGGRESWGNTLAKVMPRTRATLVAHQGHGRFDRAIARRISYNCSLLAAICYLPAPKIWI